MLKHKLTIFFMIIFMIMSVQSGVWKKESPKAKKGENCAFNGACKSNKCVNNKCQ